ncbi:hypothetical protein pb186bvf_009482 [Paramecium bursaria]
MFGFLLRRCTNIIPVRRIIRNTRLVVPLNKYLLLQNLNTFQIQLLIQDEDEDDDLMQVTIQSMKQKKSRKEMCCPSHEQMSNLLE